MRDIARLDHYRTTRVHRDPLLSDSLPDAHPGARPDADTDRTVRPRGDAPSPGRTADGATRGAPVSPHRESPREPLWREALGGRLRAHRAERSETLGETAERAGVSPQYLSEMERGLKEPSSEMIAAVAGALGLSLPDLVGDVARHLAPPSRAVRSDPQLLAAAA